MSLCWPRCVVLIGLGAVAGAVLPALLAAQVPVPVRPDTIRVPTPPRADSIVKNDSIRQGIVPLPTAVRRDSTKRDTVKAPLTRAESPPILEIGEPRIYDRTAMFATGALTLSDLLGRVLGLTEFATGWLGAPTVVASQGNLRQVRIFVDGLELDPLGRRSQGVSPVNDLPLHSLEEIRIERGAEEVRVYARTWRVVNTDPYTRADVGTGDQNTNLYRAFFGRRFDHGEALQIAAEQYSTQPNPNLPSASGLHLMGRFGLTHGPWSADLFAERSDIDRGPWVGTVTTPDTIAALQTRRTTAYARFGNGDPERGRWFQLLAATEGLQEIPRGLIGVPDTTSYESQYLLTGGMTLLGARVSAAERLRVSSGRTSHVLSGRASFVQPWLGVSLFAEGKSALYPARAEATVKLTPLPRVALLGSASRTGAGDFSRIFGDFRPAQMFNADGTLTPGSTAEFGGLYDTTRVTVFALNPSTNLRAEAGVRLRDVWVSGGVLRRGPTTLLPPAGFDTAYAGPAALRVEGEATGATVALRGRLYKAVNVDAWAVRWNESTGLYRPQYQTRSELYIQTNLLQRFPRGNFGLLGSLAHEYRSNTHFAFGDSVRVAPGFRTLTFKLEIRIQTAVVSYQFRNLLQERYQEVPGFFMPRQWQFYGVRWEFWN